MRIVIAMLGFLLLGVAPVNVTCANGAEVRTEAQCALFRYYRPVGDPIDSRVTRLMGLAQGDRARSIAIVVGISRYPALGQALPAVDNDVRHMEAYLTGQGKFDEVIVLQNQDATKSNISYFLGEYLAKESMLYDKHLRVLFTYSGHGFSNDERSGAITLANTSGEFDVSDDNSYSFADLRAKFENVSAESFHFLALINACYAGGLFAPVADPSGNVDVPEDPTGYAYTAGPRGNLSWAIGGGEAGSVFFDAILAGLKDSAGDRGGLRLVDSNGKVVVNGSVVRLGALNTFVTDQFNNIRNDIQIGKITLPADAKLEHPVMGPITSRWPAPGGFFFLSDPYVEPNFRSRWASLGTKVQSFALGARNVSGLATGNDPIASTELKVFLAPSAYRIKGIDISHYSGAIDWNLVAKGKIRFVYMKATQGAKIKDATFEKNWRGSGAANIAHGAYHYVNICLSALSQFENIKAVVPKEPGALPLALDAEPLPAWVDGAKGSVGYSGSGTGTGFGFGKPGCAAKDQEGARSLLLDLAQRVQRYYGKTPVIFGVAETFRSLVDDRFAKFNIWMQQRPNQTLGVDLPGRVPWTLWQHSPDVRLKGIADKVDLDVFFGSEDSFNKFVTGQGNVAVSAQAVAQLSAAP